MAYGRELKIMPSVTETDGTKREWSSLTKEEREEQERNICRQISQSMSVYYSGHQEEWKKIQNEM